MTMTMVLSSSSSCKVEGAGVPAIMPIIKIILIVSKKLKRVQNRQLEAAHFT
jgi:hypothetical protein